MPAYLRGKDHSILRFVRIDAAKPLFYGWKTKDLSAITGVSETDLTFLGHQTPTQMGTVTGAIGVIGANRPKPARVKKTLVRRPGAGVQGTVSTFIGGNVIADWDILLESGWEIVEPAKRVTISDNDRSQTVGALCSNGAIYCFPMSKTVPAVVLSDLLLLPASELRLGTNEGKCVSGASKPRPPRVRKDNIVNPAGGTYDAHTFCSVDAYENALQTGWLPESGEVPYFGDIAAP
jgi:hypothetical protein